MQFNFNHALTNEMDFLKMNALKYTKSSELFADDLVQETILRALKYKDRFKPNTNLRAWLVIIMKSIYINYYRREVKRRMNLNDSSDINYFFESSSPAIHNDGDSNMAMAFITHSVDKLEEKYRRPIELRTRGYSYQEIAEQLDIPLGTVKSQIHYSRKQLKELLSDYLNEN